MEHVDHTPTLARPARDPSPLIDREHVAKGDLRRVG
jgi:hypothetical protein